VALRKLRLLPKRKELFFPPNCPQGASATWCGSGVWMAHVWAGTPPLEWPLCKEPSESSAFTPQPRGRGNAAVRQPWSLEGSGNAMCGEGAGLRSSARGPGSGCESVGRPEQALFLAGQGFILLGC